MKLFWRIVAICAAVLAGLGLFSWLQLKNMAVAYGPPEPVKYGTPPVHLEVKSFTYAPPGTVHVGDTLVFTAELEPQQYCSVRVQTHADQFTNPPELTLHDDGKSPDAVAGDNIYSGRLKWTKEYGTGDCAATLWAPCQKDDRPAAASGEVEFEVLP